MQDPGSQPTPRNPEIWGTGREMAILMNEVGSKMQDPGSQPKSRNPEILGTHHEMAILIKEANSKCKIQAASPDPETQRSGAQAEKWQFL